MNMLFSPMAVGKLNLNNRIVMAPMTRSRAMQNRPNDLMENKGNLDYSI